MKTYIKSNKHKPLSFTFFMFAILVVVACFVSCSKDNSNASVSAYVMAANSAQTSSPQDFYVDNAKQNNSPMAYGQSSGFIAINSGSHQGQFKTSSTANVNSSFSFTTSPGTYYTIYYADDNSATTTQNDRTAPQSGNSRVRFINLNAALNSSVDFGINGGAKVVSGLAYKTASTYNEVAAASQFSLYSSGSSTVLLNIPVVLQAGKIYTVVISGTTSATVSYTLVAEN